MKYTIALLALLICQPAFADELIDLQARHDALTVQIDTVESDYRIVQEKMRALKIEYSEISNRILTLKQLKELDATQPMN